MLTICGAADSGHVQVAFFVHGLAFWFMGGRVTGGAVEDHIHGGGLMGWERKPVHRQHMIPWYDTGFVCRVVFWLLLPVLIFGMVGVLEALKREAWPLYIGMPLSMSMISGWIMVRMTLRVFRRKMSGDGCQGK
ncbi:hypothetical protein OOT00_00830 [Desulfobotulus sp. H1]|uniref:Uncharacterized protein n=1 Tax=Desulfobotulus pelophilus TaxID=2823377 RepID=A0ABT3N4Z6_9BACT|nr:hypothetical protein [Desulfobotulus pelophilus]MCW7752524.1 hypothetical protein [Desulfobotulus pelophilus]